MGLDLQVEKAVEDAIKDFLEDALQDTEPDLVVSVGTGAADLITPRIEVEASGMVAVRPLDRLTDGSLEYKKYDLGLMLTVITDLAQGATRTKHHSLVGDLRTKMLQEVANWTSTNLPNHEIREVVQTGSSRETQGELQATATDYALRVVCKETSGSQSGSGLA